jgi:cell division protein FtsW
MNPRAESTLRRPHHPDYGLAVIVAILLAIGLVIMYSISPILSHKISAKTPASYYFVNQMRYVILGVVFWIGATAVPYVRWRAWAPKFLGVAAVLVLALMVPGIAHSSNGATRWLQVGPLTIQPAEILKVALILYLAVWFERRGREAQSFSAGVMPFLVMVGVALFAVVVLQKDFGTAVVIAGAVVAMYFTAGLRWRHLAGIAVVGALAAVLAVVPFAHRMQRINTFLHLSCNNLAALATSPDYHTCQALIAAGSGGVFGLGLGHSIQVYGYLPEAANDSIFAIIAEEFGLFGSLVIIGLFGLLVWRGLQVARMAPDTFSRLVAVGITIWMLVQALVNIGAMISLIPLTGIPLPFISYGGTSLVVSLFGMGILLNISKYTVSEVGDANSRQRRGDSRAYLAGAGNLRRVKIAR